MNSIFFGGGTPSLLRPDLLERILVTLAEYFQWDQTTEITMECNPKTIDLEGLRERRSLGINRLSLGVQSFQDHFLKRLGRIHSGQEAKQTILAAQQAGFENVNFDLIFALPGQSHDDWKQDLEIALDLGTPHLSCYALTIEPGTPFEKLYGRVGSESALPSDDIALQQFWYTRERLTQAGLEAYEISNFARPGYECRHNQHYWNYGEYVGFGVSAASFYKIPPFVKGGQGGFKRTANARDLQKYIDGDYQIEIDPIEQITAQGEFVMLALRTREGLSERHFRELFGEEFTEVFEEVLSPLKEQHPSSAVATATEGEAAPLHHDQGHWKLTDRGLEVADTVISPFVKGD